MRLALAAIIFAIGLAVSLALTTAPAHATSLADLPALGYVLALRFDVQSGCGMYWVTGGNGAQETLIGDPSHPGCQEPGAIEAHIANLLALYPPVVTTTVAAPVTVTFPVTVTLTETLTNLVTTTAPAVTSTLTIPTTVTVPTTELVTQPAETVTSTQTLEVPTTVTVPTTTVETVTEPVTVPSSVETVTQTETVTAHALACGYRADGALPDVICTPGALNPAVTQATIRTTICKAGWTATIRPPLSWSAPHKLAAMQAYSAQGSPADFEYDHLISLELGGAPRDTLNLWPQPHASSFVKDATENRLRRAVCSGALSLRAAQTAIRTDWRSAP